MGSESMGSTVSRRRPRALLALAAPAAVAALTVVGGAAAASPAHTGSAPTRLAHGYPLLLLKGPGGGSRTPRKNGGAKGSRVERIRHRQADPLRIDQVSGPQHPRESGMLPPAVRQRRVELSWRPGSSRNDRHGSTACRTRTAARWSTCPCSARPPRSTRATSSTQPGRPRQPPDDRPLGRRRRRARTARRGPRPGRLRRTARLADQGRPADLAGGDAGEGRAPGRLRRTSREMLKGIPTPRASRHRASPTKASSPTATRWARRRPGPSPASGSANGARPPRSGDAAAEAKP